MAKSSYQQNIVKRYYENRDTQALQNLGEIVSDLFLCESPSQAAKLWDRAAKALKHTDAQPSDFEKILIDRDVTGLTRLVNQLTTPGGRPAAKSSPPTPTTPAAAPTPPQPTATRGIPSRSSTPTPQASIDPADPLVLKRAMKSFRKRLKLTRLDEESKLGRSPLTTGKSSGVVAISPPNQFPLAV